MIKGIQEAVTIPVMAKARIGHFAEAQVLQSLEVDYVDESEVLTVGRRGQPHRQARFRVPFVCGATELGEALRRIGEGAAMIRSKGEAGTGNIVEAVRHLRDIIGGIKRLGTLGPEQLSSAAKDLRAPIDVVEEVARTGWLPVPLFCAGGIATPADAALTMQLGAEGNFVGSGIFKSSDPERMARAVVEATTHFNDPERVAAASIGPRRGDARRRHRRAGGTGASCCSSAGSDLAGGGSALRIGVLASQGDFAAHASMLRGLDADAVEVRTPEALTGLDGLVIPGGESTTMMKAIERDGLAPAIRAHVAEGRPILGTCAGMIVCDREHLGLVDVSCRRNAFGRQIASFEADLELSGIGPEPLRAVFIRAPWVERPRPRRRGARRGRRPPGRRGHRSVPALRVSSGAHRRLARARTLDGDGDRGPPPARAGRR